MEKKEIFDIISLPIELDRSKIDSRYRLAILAAQRAAELSLGATAKIEKRSKKVTTTAILELLMNKIEFVTGEEALKAKDKIERIDIKKLLDEKRKAIPDLTELEKDLKVYLHTKETAEKMLEELFADSDEQTNEEE